jgi:hypothetical protein
LRVLADSNLDWGQDLPELARWLNEHPSRPIYLGYFGTDEPTTYGINATPLRRSSDRGASGILPSQVVGPATVAISATLLQGVYFNDPLREQYAAIRSRAPTAMLGGTIYIYELAPGERLAPMK